MAAMPMIKPALIPPEVGKKVFASTLDAMRRVQTDDPERWARIEARAAQLKAERMMLNADK